MSRRAIIIIPDLPAEPIRVLRWRFDPLARSVPPHLTLVFPFESDLPAAELRAHVEQATAGIPTFPLRLAGIVGSEGEYLFLTVRRGNDALVELHDRLYQGPLRPYLSREHPFVPHITVGRLADPTAFRAALAYATALDVNVQTTAQTVTIYRLTPSGERPREAEVSLRGAAPADAAGWRGGAMLEVRWVDGLPPAGLPVTQVYGWCFTRSGDLIVLEDGGRYTLPGGKPEEGETFAATLRREALEEGQLTLGAIQPFGYRCIEDDRDVLAGRPYAQVRAVALVDRELPPAVDPATGRQYHRLAVRPEEAERLLAWGAEGARQLAAARRCLAELRLRNSDSA